MAAEPHRRSGLELPVDLRLLGSVSIHRQGLPPVELPAKAMELLCYVLVHRDRGHTREALSALLWPEASSSMARKYLRQALWQLQSAQVVQLLQLTPGWVRLAPAGWRLDIDTFERAWETSRDVPGARLSRADAGALEEAVELYRGDLIETLYSDWCIYERDRLQLVYLAMLEKLMGYCEDRQRYPQGIAYGQRILRYDPAREITHQHLMRLHYRAGDRTTALRQFARCSEALGRELGVAPAPQTITLRDQVRADDLDAPARPVEPGGGLLVELSRCLDQLQDSLLLVRQHVALILNTNPSDVRRDGT